jgi:diaminohydroxyphosphoribosylaminopyrimidine deaminase/5-amino-6-(5-phosphoribosylamino)uracil reductase
MNRANADAIAVGTQTVLIDNPELLARKVDGTHCTTQPQRIVIGMSDLPTDSKVFATERPAIQIKNRNLAEVLQQLWSQGIKHLLVEGGPTLASEFVKQGLVDEFHIYLAPKLLGGPKTSLTDIGVGTMGQEIDLEILETAALGKDIFIRARRA